MRIGLIGLSTPVAYDYKNLADKAQTNESSSPNPLLFGATAIMLLFDEIWFVTRSLCPQSMRELKFVKFLDEEGIISENLLSQIIPDYVSDKEAILNSLRLGDYQSVLGKVSDLSRFGWDNHSRGLRIAGRSFMANSASPHNTAIDLGIKNALRNPQVELVHNPRWYDQLELEVRSIKEVAVTEELVLRQIPNAINERGPKTNDILRWRDNNYIGDYRTWVSSQPLPERLSKVEELGDRLEKDIFRAMKRAYLKESNRYAIYKSLTKTAAGELAGLVVPGASLILDIPLKLREEARRQEGRWRAFLLSLEEDVQKDSSY